MLESFTFDTFSPLRGDTFVMHVDSTNAVPLELTEVTSMGGSAPAAGPGTRQPFSLLFHGPLTPLAAQAIYRLEHPTLGEFELFLVPLGPDQHGMRYEAVFT